MGGRTRKLAFKLVGGEGGGVIPAGRCLSDCSEVSSIALIGTARSHVPDHSTARKLGLLLYSYPSCSNIQLHPPTTIPRTHTHTPTPSLTHFSNACKCCRYGIDDPEDVDLDGPGDGSSPPEGPTCQCGLPARSATSRSEKNPNRSGF